MPEPDDLAHVPIGRYLESHSKPDGKGWGSFLHSNLFSALVIWTLSQAVIVGGILITFYLKTSQLSDWKAKAETTLDIVVKQSNDDHYEITTLKQESAAARTKIDEMAKETSHFDVMENEHRRLTKDVEDLKLKR